MKEYLFLYKEFNNRYYDFMSNSKNSLNYLRAYFSEDYKSYDQDLFVNAINFYDSNFIYHDMVNKILYIGSSEWELDENIDAPSREDFPNYVNETNTCKLNVDNYLKFSKKWTELKKDLPPFAIIYRDDHDWVDCKGFDSQEAMELFVKNYQPETHH